MIAQIQLRNIVILIALVDIRPARCDNFFKTVNLFTVLCTVVKFLSKQNGRGLEYKDQYILFSYLHHNRVVRYLIIQTFPD